MASFVVHWFVCIICSPFPFFKITEESAFSSGGGEDLVVVTVVDLGFIFSLVGNFCPPSSSSSSSLCWDRGEGAGRHVSYMMFVSVAREWICGEKSKCFNNSPNWDFKNSATYFSCIELAKNRKWIDYNNNSGKYANLWHVAIYNNSIVRFLSLPPNWMNYKLIIITDSISLLKWDEIDEITPSVLTLL